MGRTSVQITPYGMSRIVSLFDHLYRKGIRDAHRERNEGLCREHIEATSVAGFFGFIETDPKVEWGEWGIELARITRRTGFSNIISEILRLDRRFGSTYLSCAFTIAQGFYNLGIKHYIEHPNADDVANLNPRTRVFWTDEGIKNGKIDHWIQEVQSLAFELERRDAKIWEEYPTAYARNHALKPGQYEIFRQRINMVRTKTKSDHNFSIYD